METTTDFLELNDDIIQITTRTIMTKVELKIISDVYSPSKNIVCNAELTDGFFQESADVEKMKGLISEASGLDLKCQE